MPDTSSCYPRIYKPRLFWKLFLALGGIAIAASGVFLLGLAWLKSPPHDPAGMYILAGLGLLSSICGVVCVYAALFAKVLILEADALIAPGLLHDTRIPRAQIIGYRYFVHQGVRGQQIQYRNTRGKIRHKKIALTFKADSVLEAWFAGIPNLDAMAYEASLQAVREDTALGGTPEARERNARNARKIARVMNTSVLALGFWCFLYPHPYLLVFLLLAALPLVSLWLCWRYPGSFSLDDKRSTSARGELSGAFIGPGLILTLRALQDTHLLAPSALITPGLTLLVALLAVVFYVVPQFRQRPAAFLMLCIIFASYPFSVLAIANDIFDSNPPAPHAVQITSQYRTTGRGASRYLRLAQAEAIPELHVVQVSPSFYDAVRTGDTICILLHPGSIGLAWYEVQALSDCTR